MKKIIAFILLAVTALSLFSCQKAEFVKMDAEKIEIVTLTAAKDIEADKAKLCELYNKAEIKGFAKEEEYKSSQDVIVAAYEGGKDHITLYYLGKAKFAVTGSGIEKPYYVKSAELEAFYNDLAHPAAEFVAVDASKIESAFFALNTEIEVDAKAVAEEYNKAKFVGEATDEKGNNALLLVYEGGKDIFSVTHIEGNTFRVSGNLVRVDFIIESAELAKLFPESTSK